MAGICAISIQTTGAVVLAFVTIGAVGFITGVALTNGGPVSWSTGLAVGRISCTIDAVGVCTGRDETDQQDKPQKL